jgi:hypothetical protein
MKIIIALILALFLLLYNVKPNRNYTQTHTLWVKDSPLSSDPMDIDFIIHHICFNAVFTPLVSHYSNSGITGQISDSWSVSDDFKTWTFHIRQDLTFENSDKITTDVVMKSLKRVAYLLNKKKSFNGLFEFVEGFTQITKIDTPIKGLTKNSESITFQFIKPMKNTLELLSFGMYSIVHPSQYNEVTGEWIDTKKAISSGAYKVASWNQNEFFLEKREHFKSAFSAELIPDELHALKKIKVVWSKNLKPNADLIYGNSDDALEKEKRQFIGGTIAEIRFIRCASWFLPGSPCFDIGNRKIFRAKFYEHLTSLGLKPVYSFYPTIMAYISEPDHSEISLLSKKKLTLERDLKIVNTSATNPIVQNGYLQSFEKISNETGKSIKTLSLEYDDIIKNVSTRSKNIPFDISTNGSGMYIDKPEEDIHFMFKSKEGVNIPDTDGRISAELDKTNIDFQKINELIWDQAVVWPLVHYAIGFWAKQNEYSFRYINTLQSPTHFELLATE